MAILKVKPNAIDTTGNFAVGAVTTTGNVNVGGNIYLTGDLLPTSNNIVNIGSASNRFGTLYLAANTIDIGGTTITTAPSGELVFATQAGNVSLSSNTINFLSSVANTSTNQGDLTVSGNIVANKIYANSYFYSDGSSLTGTAGYTGSVGAGYTGSAGVLGYTGSAGNTGPIGYTGSSGSSGSAGTIGYTGSQGTNGSGYINLSMVGAISPPFTGTARFYPPSAVTVNTVYANLSDAPTGGNLNFVIKKNGTSIGNTFVLSTALMTPVSVNVSLVTTDYLTLDVSGVAASDLYVRLKYA